jgi:glyoxylate/hydroxypyruvate reductase A
LTIVEARRSAAAENGAPRRTVIVAIAERSRAAAWRERLAALLPDYNVVDDTEPTPADRVRYAVVWKPSRGFFGAYPSLRAILSIGAGIEDILSDPALPEEIAIVRMIDAALTAGMREYVLLHVLRYHRRQPDFEIFQREQRWQPIAAGTAVERRVGVMGLGVLGLDAARHLSSLGFKVAGWKRKQAACDGIEVFAGREGLDAFLARTQILVCLLPLTASTRGLIDAAFLRKLPRGASLINASRGECLVEDDLLAEIDSGHIAGATLDVFAREPPPPDHPFWRHPKITVTPHVASLTALDGGARHIAAAIADLEANRVPQGLVSRGNGY